MGRSTGWPTPTCCPRPFPRPSIYTYDWNANYFEDAPVQTLLGQADTLLGLVANGRSAERPLIFVASCFGGLVLAEVRLPGMPKDYLSNRRRP